MIINSAIPSVGAQTASPSVKTGLDQLGKGIASAENSPQGLDFSQLLADVGNSTIQSIQKAEATSIAGLKGEADTYDVVTSVMEAEQSLRMMVSVRDKIVNAYLEISRMQI